MCGITGLVDFAGVDAGAAEVVTRMNDVQLHRGPDGGGLWVGTVAALAHRRLSVIDIAHGAQPMVHRDREGRDRFVLSYNGELYNHIELRQELRGRGHAFRTTSDTEVLLAAWAEWGPRAVDRLNGIFAFAVWDATEEVLWLVRDHLGVKPLHYRIDDKRLVFGSEVKAILAHPDVPTVIDDDGLRHLLVPLLKIPGANPYQGISEVLPGHALAFSRRGVRTIRYWDIAEVLARPAATDDPTDAAKQLEALLHDTVERQSIADVPLCTFLSGGLDSSVVTALANRLPRTKALKSFSVDFLDTTGADNSRSALDRRYAREAADYIGSEHTNILLDSSLLADRGLRDESVRARDLPNGFGDLDTSLLLLLREIRKRATVALSGEAADEILGGYRWFSERGAVQADTFPWIADTPAHGHLHQRLLGTLDPDLAKRLDLETFLRDEYKTGIGRLDFGDGISRQERRHREILALAVTYFLPTLLDRNDRLSMAGGLEVRVPFCDHRIVEFVVTLPRDIHFAGGREKGVLRDAIGDLLPPGVRERTKSPYPTTPDPEYSRRLSENVTEVLSAPPSALRDIFSAEVLDPARIADSKRLNGLVSNFEGEVILNFASWLRQYEPSFAV